MRTQLWMLASVALASLTQPSLSAEDQYPNSHELAFPQPALLQLHLDGDFGFRFSWRPVAGATLYHLQQKISSRDQFVDLAANLPADLHHYRLYPALMERSTRLYRLLSCNALGCSPSNTLTVRSNAATDLTQWLPQQRSDLFGAALSFNQDGTLLAVGAPSANMRNVKSGLGSGAVYVFQHEQGRWQPPAALAASAIPASVERFGYSVRLAADGRALAVGSQLRDGERNSSALHLFARRGQNDWRATLDAPPSWRPNTDLPPLPASFSEDGATLALSHHYEFIQYRLDGASNRQLQDINHVRAVALLEAAVASPHWLIPQSADPAAWFGYAVSLSGNGRVLAVGAPRLANGFGDRTEPGEVYVYQREPGGRWRLQSQLQPRVQRTSELFGYAVSLNGDGSVLAISAFGRPVSQTATTSSDDSDSQGQGLVHVFTRTASTDWQFNTLLTAPTGAWQMLAQTAAANRLR